MGYEFPGLRPALAEITPLGFWNRGMVAAPTLKEEAIAITLAPTLGNLGNLRNLRVIRAGKADGVLSLRESRQVGIAQGEALGIEYNKTFPEPRRGDFNNPGILFNPCRVDFRLAIYHGLRSLKLAPSRLAGTIHVQSRRDWGGLKTPPPGRVRNRNHNRPFLFRFLCSAETEKVRPAILRETDSRATIRSAPAGRFGVRRLDAALISRGAGRLRSQ